MRRFFSSLIVIALCSLPASAQMIGEGVWKAIQSAPLSLTNTASATNDSPSYISQVFTADCGSTCSIGAAPTGANTRRVIFVLCTRLAAGGFSDPTAMNINVAGGGAVSMGSSIVNGGSGGFGCTAYSKTQSTGTTAVFTVDVTSQAQPADLSYAVYSLNNSTIANDDPKPSLTAQSGPTATINNSSFVVIGAGSSGFNITSDTQTNLGTPDTDHTSANCNCQKTIAAQTTLQSGSATYAISWNVSANVSSGGFMIGFRP
jgi:hypothetical protein